MKLYAISDLHVGSQVNRQAVATLKAPEKGAWLILAGDLGETCEHLEFIFSTLNGEFSKLIWVPGNHELWSLPSESPKLEGVARYQTMVELARKHGVVTPEDEFPLFRRGKQTWQIAPLFLLYDYSFAPSDISESQAVAWAQEKDILCGDEVVLKASPYGSIADWCRARLAYTEERLQKLDNDVPAVLINHFPLRNDLVRLRPAIERFRIWCGTQATRDWHRKFRADVVVTGHLHMRATDYRDDTRFEEVSLGMPGQWNQEKGIQNYLREILPGPKKPKEGSQGPIWHR